MPVKETYAAHMCTDKEVSMSEDKSQDARQEQDRPQHSHQNGRRCCGRPLSEKCSPEEEASRLNPVTGTKSCCKGQ